MLNNFNYKHIAIPPHGRENWLMWQLVSCFEPDKDSKLVCRFFLATMIPDALVIPMIFNSLAKLVIMNGEKLLLAFKSAVLPWKNKTSHVV